MKSIRRFLLLSLLIPLCATAADTIVFRNGARLSGEVTAIDQGAKTVTILFRSLTRRYAFKDILSVTQNGKQINLGAAPASTDGNSAVERLIRTTGASKPDWSDATKLNYPSTMDLNWTMPAPKPWNGKKNIGQFIWDTINPNQGRWREGIRFMYFLIERSPNGSHVNNMAKKGLASMYFRLFQDYPRAAYWWRQADLKSNDPGYILLAECYFRMGSADMAMAALANKPANTQTVKLLGAMGKTDQAVRLTEALARSRQPHELFLLAGDALALAGQYQKAITYYRKVLTDPRKPRNKQYENRQYARARESISAIQLFELLDVTKLKNGTYTDSATGYNGPIRIEAKVTGGRITSLRVLQHKEKQYYSALRDVPAQITSKQSVKDIDATSRATITAQAIVNATAKALNKGR